MQRVDSLFTGKKHVAVLMVLNVGRIVGFMHAQAFRNRLEELRAVLTHLNVGEMRKLMANAAG